MSGSKTQGRPRRGRGATRLPMAGSAPGSRGVDLNRIAITRQFLTSPWVQPALQVAVIGIFVWGLWQTFVGPQDPDTNFGAVAFFGLWWTPVMLLSLLFFGRIWCYVCPVGAITQFLQRFSLNRRFPTFQKPHVRVLGVGFSVLSIAALSFTLARLPLYKFGVAYTPWKMGVYFLVFLGVAVTLTLVFRQRVFCRYFCPATGVMSVTTRFSPLEISQDRDSDVPDCMTAEFKSEYLSTERRCVSCMHCSVRQPDVPVRLRARWPGAAAVRQRLSIPDEALIALIIWAVFPIDHVLGGEILSQMAAVQALPGILSGVVPYYGSIALTVLAFLVVNWIAARWSGVEPRSAFVRFAFAYATLGLGFQVGAHLIPGLMENGGGLINAFAAGLGVPLHLPVAWASAETHEAFVRFGNNGFLWLSVLWGAGIAWLVARDLTETTPAALKAVLPHVLLMAGSTYVVVGLLG
jgi:polyferredoxin